MWLELKFVRSVTKVSRDC